MIPLNNDTFKAMLEWQARFPDAKREHYDFPFCEPKHKTPDPLRRASEQRGKRRWNALAFIARFTIYGLRRLASWLSGRRPIKLS